MRVVRVRVRCGGPEQAERDRPGVITRTGQVFIYLLFVPLLPDGDDEMARGMMARRSWQDVVVEWWKRGGGSGGGGGSGSRG